MTATNTSVLSTYTVMYNALSQTDRQTDRRTEAVGGSVCGGSSDVIAPWVVLVDW